MKKKLSVRTKTPLLLNFLLASGRNSGKSYKEYHSYPKKKNCCSLFFSFFIPSTSSLLLLLSSSSFFCLLRSSFFFTMPTPHSQDRFNSLVWGGNIVWFGLASYHFTVKAPEFVSRHVTGEVRRLSSPSALLSSLSSSSSSSSIPPLHQPIVYTARFLGGMNSSLVLLSLLRLKRTLFKLSHKQHYNLSPTSKEGRERERERENEVNFEREVLIVSSLAHFSQFIFNVIPFWRVVGWGGTGWRGREKAGNPVRVTWELLFIFVLDAFMAFLNGYAAYRLK